MAGPLADPRREALAAAIAAGANQGEAWVLAAAAVGLDRSPIRQNAGRWLAEPAVAARVAELRSAAQPAAVLIETDADALGLLQEVLAALQTAIAVAEAADFDAASLDKARRALALHIGRLQHRAVQSTAQRAAALGGGAAAQHDAGGLDLDQALSRLAALRCQCAPGRAG